jgi:hypothetical protein
MSTTEATAESRRDALQRQVTDRVVQQAADRLQQLVPDVAFSGTYGAHPRSWPARTRF